MGLLPGAEPFSADGGPVGILVLHGFTGTPQGVRAWARAAAAAGHTVRAPRLPGHGTRWRDLGRTRWSDWYAEADREFASLTGRCSSVFVFGLSVGGALALRLAERHGHGVAGVVTVNASLGTERREAALLPVLRFVVPFFPGVGGDIKKPDATELAYTRLPLQAVYSLSQGWSEVRADLDRVVSPVLAFRSRVDHVVEPVSGRLLMAGATSCAIEERILEDSYHVATLDNDAPRIEAESLAFVAAQVEAARVGTDPP